MSVYACACACVCVWSVILTTLTAGARLLYRAGLSPLANGSSNGGDWGPDSRGLCGGEVYRDTTSIVDRRSCEPVVRNPKGAIVFCTSYYATRSACSLPVYLIKAYNADVTRFVSWQGPKTVETTKKIIYSQQKTYILKAANHIMMYLTGIPKNSKD